MTDDATNAIEERAFAFVESVRKQAAAFVDAAVAEIEFEDNADPKLYGLALLCRSISNFQSALTLARRDQAVESLTLVRSCLENLFLIHDLRERRADSVRDIRSNDDFYKRLLSKAALKRPGVDDKLRAIINDLVERLDLKKPQKLTVRATAKGEIAWMYDAYARLSHDAAHPSITALSATFGRSMAATRWRTSSCRRSSRGRGCRHWTGRATRFFSLAHASVCWWAERRRTLPFTRSGSNSCAKVATQRLNHDPRHPSGVRPRHDRPGARPDPHLRDARQHPPLLRPPLPMSRPRSDTVGLTGVHPRRRRRVLPSWDPPVWR
jgi:hypothetical protein